MRRNPAAQKALGAVLREFRRRDPRLLSQEDLADLAGVHRTYVGLVERGRQNPTFESLWYLLHALGLSWQELGAALDRQPALQLRPASRPER